MYCSIYRRTYSNTPITIEEFPVSVSDDCTAEVTSKDGSVTISADRERGGYRIVGFDERNRLR